MKEKINQLQNEILQMKKNNLNTKALENALDILKQNFYNSLSAWDRVQLSRSASRPSASDYIQSIFLDFIELHGDRYFSDDPSIIGGIARFQDRPVTVIGIQKGKTTEENILRNFGMPHPEGYRKTLRLMEQADKFGRPIIIFIDTPGAYPGIGAEERGQASAIANNLMKMMDFGVPILSIIIGEGGSGGALALAVSNEVWILENATFSILSPEGFAAILYKDASKAPQAAEQMKITSNELFDLGIVEKIIEEKTTHLSDENLADMSEYMMDAIQDFLLRFDKLTPEQRREARWKRFRQFGGQ